MPMSHVESVDPRLGLLIHRGQDFGPRISTGAATNRWSHLGIGLSGPGMVTGLGLIVHLRLHPKAYQTSATVTSRLARVAFHELVRMYADLETQKVGDCPFSVLPDSRTLMIKLVTPQT